MNAIGRGVLPAVVALALLGAGCGSSGGTGKQASGVTTTSVGTTKAPKTSRGFDGSTVTVAGMGLKGQLPGAEFGARARIKRFNDANELPGVKIQYTEFADDKGDPATALSEARRLVTDVKALALVGDVSANTPGSYLAQQHVPYFGWAFDDSYCSDAPDDSLWGFGFNGCLVSSHHPKMAPDSYTPLHTYVAKETGKERPTLANFSSDTTSGHASTKSTVALTGAGFDVVFSKGIVPPPPTSDYTPYVQRLLASDHGHAPDVIICSLAVDCIPMYKGLRAAGFTGIFQHNLYSDALLAPMKGSVAGTFLVPFDTPNAGLTQLKADVSAVNPSQVIDIGVAGGYFSTDMFIQALKKAKAGGGISAENVRAAASHMTWEIKGLAGPTRYPESTAIPTPYCVGYTISTGTEWKTVAPFTCSERTFPNP